MNNLNRHSHMTALRSVLKKNQENRRTGRGIVLESCGHFFNVTELKYRDGSIAYYHDSKGSIRSVRRDAIRAKRAAEAKALKAAIEAKKASR